MEKSGEQETGMAHGVAVRRRRAILWQACSVNLLGGHVGSWYQNMAARSAQHNQPASKIKMKNMHDENKGWADEALGRAGMVKWRQKNRQAWHQASWEMAVKIRTSWQLA
ncbi:hypothetical protein NPIL_107431 [Nephila pilipes]|uniref:Uncharacterized protein n=1 Tax=Nephila pilipes TaxID=299642 RepID=A0A8X6NW09_NEPPI|nr:hypothetical protein NPIL_107431 [Nephila pilipes]